MISLVTSEGAVEVHRAALAHVSLVWRANPPATVAHVRASYTGVCAFRDLLYELAPEGSPREYTCLELLDALSLAFSFRATGVVRRILEYVASPRDFVSVEDEMCAQQILLACDARYPLPPLMLTRLRDTIVGAPYPVLQFLWRIAAYPGDAGFPAHKLSFRTLHALRAPHLRHAWRVAACKVLQRFIRRRILGRRLQAWCA